MQADITWRADDAEDSFLRDLFLKGWNKRTGQIVLRAMKKQPFHPNKIRVMPVFCRILTSTWRPIPCRDWGNWPGAWTVGHECRISRFTATFETKPQIDTRSMLSDFQIRWKWSQIRLSQAYSPSPNRRDSSTGWSPGFEWQARAEMAETQRGRWRIGWNFGCQHNGRFGYCLLKCIGMIHVESCRGSIVLGHTPRCFGLTFS